MIEGASHEAEMGTGVGAIGAETSNSKTTSYIVRCTPAQKETLQSLAFASGHNVADFLVLAAKQASPKTKEETELEKDLSEMDELIERLTGMLKAKVLVAHEVTKRSQEEKNSLNKERMKTEEELVFLKEESANEIEERKQELELQFKQKELEWEKALKDVDVAWQSKWVALKELSEKLESDLLQKTQEIKVREKQHSDSVRLHETIEQRNFDLKARNDELQKKLSQLERYKETTEHHLQQLEKQTVEYKHQLELQKTKHEEELKHLEREFDLKAKVLELEIEKRLLINKI